MECPTAKVQDFNLLCCPEGTYVEKGGRLLSFSREPRSECIQSLATETEDTGRSVFVISVVFGVILILMIWCYCRAWKKKREEEKRERRREQREKAKKLKREKRVAVQKAKNKEKSRKKNKKDGE